MAGRQMSALAHLGANDTPLKQKPTLQRHQSAIAATAESQPYPTTSVSRTSKAPGERISGRRQNSKTPSPISSPFETRQTRHDIMVTDHGENYGDNDDSRQSPSSSRNYLDSNLPFESSLRSPHCHSPISPPMHNPTDTSGSSQPASPATPVGDPSTKLSAMQTVQTYLTQETQAIQTHLTTVLPGLIQDEVRTQCSQLAQEISGQISSLRKEVLSPTGDQDDPMSPSIEGEGENEHSSGRGKRSARHSRDKGKKGARRFATEDDKANNGDEPDEDEGGENESTDEMSGGRRKYKKQAIVLRGPLRDFLLQKGVVVREENGFPVLPLPPCAPATHVTQFVEKHTRIGPDVSNIQYNWQMPLGMCPWNRQATLLLAQEYLELYRGGGIEVDCCILPYNAKVDLKTIQKTIRLRLVRTQTYWKELNSRDNDDSDAIPLQKRAEEKVTLTRRRTRGTHSLKQREANIEKFLDGDLKEDLLNMLQRLQSAGMNYDITDSESSDRALQSCTHWWLSTDVISILHELDTLGKRANALKLVSKKGNRPLPRTKTTKIVYDTPKTTSLPSNWYRHEWYESLCPFERSDLKCVDPENLPSILNLREAIQHLLTRGFSQ